MISTLKQKNMEQIKPGDKKSKTRYKGVFVGKEHIFFTAMTSMKRINVVNRPYARVYTDKSEAVIRIVFTDSPVDTFEIRPGVSYTYYISCPVAERGMPEGRYYEIEDQSVLNEVGELVCVYQHADKTNSAEAEG